MDKRIRIGVIESRMLARESLVRLLEAEPDFDIAGHWGSGDTALRALRSSAVDVMLLRYDVGDVATFRQMRALVAQTPLIVLTDHRFDELEVAALIRVGVAAVIDARTSSDEVGRRIRGVHSGTEQFDAAYLRSVIVKLAERQLTPLNERQLHVLSCIQEGLGNGEIAARLQISVGSVKAVLQQLFAKVGVRRRSQLVLKAPEINRLALQHVDRFISGAAVGHDLTLRLQGEQAPEALTKQDVIVNQQQSDAFRGHRFRGPSPRRIGPL